MSSEHEAPAPRRRLPPNLPFPPFPQPERSGRRTAVLGALAAALVVGGVVAFGLGPRYAPIDGPVPQRLAPLRVTQDPRTGEQTAAFSGFAVSVDTVPQDAVVFVDGVERGEAPVFAGLSCLPGAKVEVRAERRGFAPARTTTTCRADQLVKLELRLHRE